MNKTLLALVVGLAMLIPSAAFAASSSCQAYGGKTCPPTSNTTTTTSPAPTTSTSPVPTTSTPANGATTVSAGTTAPGTLPFTGLDLAALVGGATVLLGAGLVVRHLSRDQHN